jgi:hypothetical protein
LLCVALAGVHVLLPLLLLLLLLLLRLLGALLLLAVASRLYAVLMQLLLCPIRSI